MDKREEIRAKALADLQHSGVLMLNGHFDYGNGSPDPSIGGDAFSIRWTGQVMARFTGPLNFHVFSDDGASVRR
jgi:hypothetical protein